MQAFLPVLLTLVALAMQLGAAFTFLRSDTFRFKVGEMHADSLATARFSVVGLTVCAFMFTVGMREGFGLASEHLAGLLLILLCSAIALAVALLDFNKLKALHQVQWKPGRAGIGAGPSDLSTVPA